VFLIMGRIARRDVPVLVGLFVLGGMQGLVGWWMVKSGLIDRPDVSHYRLTAHLGLAVAIFGALLWVGFDFLWGRARGRGRQLAGMATAVLALVFVQILLGGLVAGLNAGFVYNSFPTMNGMWLPPDLVTLSPFWHNFLENPVMVQFDHRIGAYVLVLAVAAMWWRGRQAPTGPQARWALHGVAAALALQFALGVATLVMVVPVGLGVLHQGGALLLFASLILLIHRLCGEERPDG
jgi:cytochrome c oxidase assembly protein subunit 15